MSSLDQLTGYYSTDTMMSIDVVGVLVFQWTCMMCLLFMKIQRIHKSTFMSKFITWILIFQNLISITEYLENFGFIVAILKGIQYVRRIFLSYFVLLLLCLSVILLYYPNFKSNAKRVRHFFNYFLPTWTIVYFIIFISLPEYPWLDVFIYTNIFVISVLYQFGLFYVSFKLIKKRINMYDPNKTIQETIEASIHMNPFSIQDQTNDDNEIDSDIIIEYNYIKNLSLFNFISNNIIFTFYIIITFLFYKIFNGYNILILSLLLSLYYITNIYTLIYLSKLECFNLTFKDIKKLANIRRNTNNPHYNPVNLDSTTASSGLSDNAMHSNNEDIL